MNNLTSIFTKLIEGPKAASRRRESIIENGEGEQSSNQSHVPLASVIADVQQSFGLGRGVREPEANRSLQTPGQNNHVPEKVRSIQTGSPGKIDSGRPQSRREGPKPEDDARKLLATAASAKPPADATIYGYNFLGSLNDVKNSFKFLSHDGAASASVAINAPTAGEDGRSHFSQMTGKSADSIKLHSFSQDEEEPKARHDQFTRKVLNVWSRIKGNHNSILEGPSVIIPKGTIMAYFADKIRSNTLPLQHTAITFDRKESMSFKKLHDSSYIMGKVLVEVMEERALWTNHVPNDDLIIALSMPNSHKLVICIFGLLKIGATYLPIDDLWPGERIAKVMLNMHPVLYIYSRETDYLNNLTSKAITACVSFDEIWKKFEIAEVTYQTVKQEPLVVKSDTLRLRSDILRNVAAFYTFAPNGAVVPLKFSNTAIFNRLSLNWKAFPYEKQEIVLLQSPIHQVTSITEIFAPLLQGITLIIVNHTDLEHPFMFSGKVQDYLITRVTISSAWLKAFLLSVKFSNTLMDWHMAFASVKIWYCMGEPVDKELAEQFFRHYLDRIKKKQKHSIALVNLLQVDENLGVLSYKIITGFKMLKSGIYSYVGRPIPNSFIYVVNEKFEIVPRGTTGEIFISSLQGSSLDMSLEDLEDASYSYKDSLHFRNHFVKSRPKSSGNWSQWSKYSFYCLQRTGCFGIVTSTCGKSHELLLESREPFMITLEGSVVDIREIGCYLEEFSTLQDYHLLIYNPGEPSQKVIAFCIPKRDKKALTAFGQNELVERINARMKNVLHRAIVPDLILLESLPKTICGKIDENVLRNIYEAERNKRIELTNFRKLFGTLRTHEAVRAASVFLPIITQMLGIPVEILVDNMDKSFQHFGGTIPQSIFIVDNLHSQQYCIGLEEFLSAENLLQVILILSKLENSDKILSFQVEMEGRHEVYQVELITDFHKYEIIDFLSEVYTAKGTMESLVGIHRDIMREHLKTTWPLYTFKYFSFIAIGMKGKFGDKHRNIGAIINVDRAKYFHQISALHTMDQSISYKQEVIEHLSSGKLIDKRSKLLEILYVGSSVKFLSPEEREKIDKILIGQSFKVAKHCQYDAVIFPCFDDLLSVICIRDYGFKVIMQCQLNRFIASDGHQPYKKFPDSYNASLCFKKVQ